ncbi:MAG: ABC transporter ATP-binding protein [Chitinophagaceae bacterium]|nr:ABC transporter ATP-binding protein [Chitinophagaceae bacterium]
MSSSASTGGTLTRALWNKLFAFVVPYRSAWYMALILAVLMAVSAPVRPYLIQVTLDAAMGKGITLPSWLQQFLPAAYRQEIVAFVIFVTAFQLIFILIETSVRFLFSFTTARLGQWVVNDLRQAVYQKVVRWELRQFDRTPIGTLTTRTINDIESINDVFSDGLIPIIADLLTIVITLTTMLFINWQLTLISLIPFPLMLAATYFFKESVNKSFMQVRNAVAQLNAFVQEHITGMHVVQAFAAEDREMKKFTAINAAHRKANIEAIFAYSVFFPVVEVVLALSTGLLVWWVSGKTADAGLLVAFILYLNQIFRPLRVIADKFNVIQMGGIAAERVFKVLENPDVEPAAAEGSYRPDQVKGAIEFRQVSFGYEEGRDVLQDINFTVPAGSTVALVGHTGSGKSSIISLLNRLYPLTRGSILLDGVDINQYDPNIVRKNIGVVLQDVFLFSGSVADNITLRNPEISRAQVEEAAQMIGVHDFILQLPGGYDYNVMERGNTLSWGQRQLISFIRALLYNPSVLVLDEATSSVDSESEQLIEKAIDRLIKGRTSIVIAHRLSTIQKASQIIVLSGGKIQEIGTHEELLAAGGAYSRLYEQQLSGTEL